MSLPNNSNLSAEPSPTRHPEGATPASPSPCIGTQNIIANANDGRWRAWLCLFNWQTFFILNEKYINLRF